jgi:hypothetical protein
MANLTTPYNPEPSVWAHDPSAGWSPNPTGVPIPRLPGPWTWDVASAVQGDAPVVIPPRERDPRVQLVVAAYHEHLAWLADVACDVLVYHKGGACPGGVPCESLPNTQREAGTILHHIVSRYDRLAPLTIFCQGRPFDHSPDFLARLSLPYDRPTSLTIHYLPDKPEQWIKDRDRVESVGGFEVRYGNATIQAHPGTPAWFDTRAWDYVFDVPMPRPLWFGYGATWAVPRGFIRARPRALWAHLLSICDSGTSGQSHTDPPINPWSLEALWRYLWSDPAEFPHHKRLEIVGRREAQVLATACPHRDCFSCAKARCGLGRGRGGEVYLSDCVDCVLEGSVSA